MKRLMLALAATILLSCQNETSSTAAAPSGGLALRIVSAKALASVESVSVKLSWDGQSKETTVGWSNKKLRLEGLPLDVRIAVHMEGWNGARGRRLVYWSGDTSLTLGSGGTSWDMDEGAPIEIKDAVVPSAPDLSKLLPAGSTVVDGKLSLTLASGKNDTVRIATTGVDSVYADGVEVDSVDGAYLIVVGAGCDSSIEVVGHSGLVSMFQIVSGRFLASANMLVEVASGAESWNRDSLSIALDEGAKDTIRIDTTGVVGVSNGEDAVSISDGKYVIIVDAPGTFKVVVRGDGARSDTFYLVVRSAAQVVTRPGLKAHLRAVPEWVGALCSLRVVIDSGEISGVSLVAPSKVAFTKVSDTLWKLDWTTTASTDDGDSLQIHVYGTGDDGEDSVQIGTKVRYDRKGPDIVASDTSLVVGKSGGTVSWKATDDRGVRSTGVQDGVGLTVTCPEDDSCYATNVKRSFAIRAVDLLGNESTRNVEVHVDSVAPNVTEAWNSSDDKPLKSLDTLWVTSATQKTGIQARIADADSKVFFAAVRAGTADTIHGALLGGGVYSISGLPPGTWDIRAYDAVGNENTWGTLRILQVLQSGDRIPGFGAHVQDLPQWVSKGCSVVVVRDSGGIDSIVSTVKFNANSDKSRWIAWWPATADSTTDSLSIAVHGQGEQGVGVIRRGVRRGIDTVGPRIEIASALEGDSFLVGKAGRKLSVDVVDSRNVDSVWFVGSGSPSVADDGLGRWSGTVTSTVTVHAIDSLGNESFLEVRVKRDSLAPTLHSVRDLFGKAISNGDTLHSGGDSGLTGLVLRASDEHGVVARMRAGESVLSPVAQGDSLVFRIKSGGSYTLEVQDTLGNVLLGARNNLLAGLAPMIPTFPVDLPDGVYGGDGTDTLVDNGNGTDVLPVTIKCPDAAATLLMRSVGDPWFSLDKNAITSFAEQDSVEFRCVERGDSSAVVKRWWIMLQRPWIKAASLEARHGRKAAIELDSLRGDWMNNPTDGAIQYCIAPSVSSSVCDDEQYWFELTSDSLITDEPLAVFARVRYWYQDPISKNANNYHSKVSVVQFVEAYSDQWHRTFDTYAYDTTAIWRTYRGHVGQVATTNTSDISSGKVELGVLKFSTTWKTSGRPSYLYPNSYVALQIDTTAYAKEHDFSGVDSIRFHYAATGTFSSIRLYPVSPGNANYWADGPQWSSTKDSGYVTIFPSGFAPVDRSSQYAVEWESIKTAITELRFLVVPKMDASLVPTGTSTTVEIDDVVIYSSKTF